MPPNSETYQSILAILRPREKHWVGDGFWVSTIFSPHMLDAQLLSPFILMDHAAPRQFTPTTKPRGVGEHPHRGFETVTFALQGEVEHRDSHGGGGTIGTGDVQWMTAASGVVHEEFHSHAFTTSGGVFEMVQLWVNLPADKKMNEPRYQLLESTSFPSFQLGDAEARLISGDVFGHHGSALTYSPITIFDLDFCEGGDTTFQLDEGSTTLIFVLSGNAKTQNDRLVSAGDLIVFDRRTNGSISVSSDKKARVLVLNGSPLNEPVVAHGPFVMNTKQEIIQAIHDYNDGKNGPIEAQIIELIPNSNC